MPKAENRAREMTYVDRVPKTVPAGAVLVHNHVPANKSGRKDWKGMTKPGTRGFRAWFAPPSPHYVPCDCGWAPEVGTHYRVTDE